MNVYTRCSRLTPGSEQQASWPLLSAQACRLPQDIPITSILGEPQVGIQPAFTLQVFHSVLIAPRSTVIDALGSWKSASVPPFTIDFEGGPSGSAWPCSPSWCHTYSFEPKVMRSTWWEKWRLLLVRGSANTSFTAWSLY